MRAFVALLSTIVLAQSPTFEVSSIKPNNSGDQNSRTSVQPGGRVVATNVTLLTIVRAAWALPATRIVAAAGLNWVDSDRFDVLAQATGDPSLEQLQSMLQNMLAERFKLAAHMQVREIPVYVLAMARNDGRFGPQLRASNSDLDCAALLASGRGATPPPSADASGVGPCSNRVNVGRYIGRTQTMERFVATMSPVVRRVIVDRTGLAGSFDLDLEWAPDQLPPGAPTSTAPPPPSDGPSIFTALQEQLGLKLESTRGPVEVLVIDHAERPTPD